MKEKKIVPQMGCDSIDLLLSDSDKKRKTDLWGADPNCDHVLDPNCWSGIRCLKCQGWKCL